MDLNFRSKKLFFIIGTVLLVGISAFLTVLVALKPVIDSRSDSQLVQIVASLSREKITLTNDLPKTLIFRFNNQDYPVYEYEMIEFMPDWSIDQSFYIIEENSEKVEKYVLENGELNPADGYFVEWGKYMNRRKPIEIHFF